jgi:hypothetical protein
MAKAEPTVGQRRLLYPAAATTSPPWTYDFVEAFRYHDHVSSH